MPTDNNFEVGKPRGLGILPLSCPNDTGGIFIKPFRKQSVTDNRRGETVHTAVATVLCLLQDAARFNVKF